MGKTPKKSEQQSEVTTETSGEVATTEKVEAAPEAEKKPVDLNKEHIQQAIALGKEMTAKGEVTKADVARKMYELIKDESREVIVEAFVQGANLTPAGAQTYYYNVKRKAGKS